MKLQPLNAVSSGDTVSAEKSSKAGEGTGKQDLVIEGIGCLVWRSRG